MTDPLERARSLRREILGDDYVDAAGEDEFQEYLTSMAWGVWARGGPLSSRDRSLVVLAMLASQGRTEELRLHAVAASRAGVTDAELDELPFQVAAYCGAPAAWALKRAIDAARNA